MKFRPWDLPRNESIALLHQYCITYVSKTKCKLLVSTGVDLIHVPRVVRGSSRSCKAKCVAFVKRAANHSIEDTAKRVIAEVESQVSILGRGGDIQRAIKMYGRIGGVLEAQRLKTGFVKDPSQRSSERSMFSLFLEDMLGTTEGMLEDVFHLPSMAIRRAVGFLNAHRILIALLLFSVLANVFLSGRSTVGYWHTRKAENIVFKAGVTSNNAMIRMVGLKEIDEVVSKGLTGLNKTNDSSW